MDLNLNRLLKLPNMIILKVQEIEDMICLHLESIKDGINQGKRKFAILNTKKRE
jgi:hypothetical protein